MLYVAISTYSALRHVRNWHVSWSDLRDIFEFEAGYPKFQKNMVPKSTDKYFFFLATSSEPLRDLGIESEPAIDHMAATLRDGIIQTYCTSCPVKIG